jgi:hypothetical protein
MPPSPATGSPGSEIKGVASGRCIDVPGFSTTNGTQLDLWECNGGGNQSWNATAAHEITVYGNKCMQISGDGAAAAWCHLDGRRAEVRPVGGAPVVCGAGTGEAFGCWAGGPPLIHSAAQRAASLAV